MSNTAGVEGMCFLTQSPVRVRILEHLDNEELLSQRELKDRIDVSRVTVRRNLDALEERELITIADRTCELTPLGDLVVDEILPAVETAAVVDQLQPFIERFPESHLDFDLRALGDATTVVAESADPYAPVNRHIERMETADRFRALLPAVGLPAMTVARDCVVEAGSQHEIVVSELLAQTILDRRGYRELIEEMVSSGNCKLLISDREIPFYLGLFEEYVQIGVEDDDGTPKALVETDAVEVCEWGERTYERYIDGAESFTP